ncbi:hypothetical protein DT304_00385 [Lactobacillus reuteri]|uniref:hypothetical protein n=1 Tax=Limosilactobacillus reuteri TaxID=1598 RepID=UPI0016521C2A|nr:hypothetical protein [Limosilactobacillus reuteri]MBC6909793.1 hypothetical protein [Limosilactobacillus reuteri]
MTRYYLYDEKTGAYRGCVKATVQPANSTLIDPALTCHFNPYFEDGKWVDKPLVAVPSATQLLLMQQSQQLAVLQSMTMQQNQSNAKLQATNAQQAIQIKQLQQMLMTANQQQAVEKAKEVTA